LTKPLPVSVRAPGRLWEAIYTPGHLFPRSGRPSGSPRGSRWPPWAVFELDASESESGSFLGMLKWVIWLPLPAHGLRGLERAFAWPASCLHLSGRLTGAPLFLYWQTHELAHGVVW